MMGKEKSKASQAKEDRIRFCYRSSRKGYSKHAIFDALRKKYGYISVHTMEGYITAARRMICDELGISHTEHVADSYAFLSELKVDESTPPVVKMQCQAEINKLLGLYRQPPPPTFDPGADRKLSPAEIRARMEKILEKADVDGGTAAGNPSEVPPDPGAKADPTPADDSGQIS